MCLYGLRLKKVHYFPHTVHYCCSSILRLSEMCRFLQRSSFGERDVFWLASYPVHCDWPNTSSLRRKCLAPYRIVRCDETNNKTYYKRGIITDYNDSYSLFTCHVASRRVNITMSAFVIGETTKKSSKWAFEFLKKIILPGCESEAPDCPCKVGVAPLYRKV